MEDVVQADLAPLVRLADGTVKQINPFSGTQVWTVPGRADRPIAQPVADPQPLRPEDHGRWCAFCERRYLETTPERSRVVRVGDHWDLRPGLTADRVFDSVADFRLIPNLFEIVTYSYWVANHGYEPTDAARARLAAYRSSRAGREHLLGLKSIKLAATGLSQNEIDAIPESERLDRSISFFAGSHDVVVARRHFADGAQDTSGLASAGTLTPDEHEQYLRLMVASMQGLYDANPHAAYVQAFQNWLRPAGASFDHLHKQLVAIDELGQGMVQQLSRLDADPGLFQRWGPGYAAEEGLVIARTPHAVAYAGVGHRFPSVEVWSNGFGRPWELGAAELRDVSDLVHAMHAATGPDVPCNEEWHHQPPGVSQPIPTRVVIKLRVSTPAGFEGGTKIYVNTIDPWTIRERTVRRLRELEREGRLAPGVSIAR
ncbi:DUF4921 family protein [Actinomycetota bacterium]